MIAALKRVESNRGAPGTDGITTKDLRTFIYHNWNVIRTQILEGKYKPLPIRKVMIPKPNGGQRELGIPTVIDRLIQQAIAQRLSPIFEPLFSEHSYGFRINRNAHQAIRKMKEYVVLGYRHVVDIDLEKFFNKVNHDKLMSLVAREVKDKRVLKLIRGYLTAEIMASGLTSPNREGTPQGSPLSPILSNIMLNELDKELERRKHKFCRYADDCNIFVKTERAAKRVFQGIQKFIEGKLKLKINMGKSKVSAVTRSKFLGYYINGCKYPKISVTKESITRFKTKVKEITRGHRRENMVGRIKRLNQLTVGWMQYFKLIEVKKPRENLDSWIRHRLRMCLLKQWWRPRTRVKMMMKSGLSRDQALIYCKVKRHWFLSDTKYMNYVFNKEYWNRMGFISLEESFNKFSSVLQTALVRNRMPGGVRGRG